MEQTSHKNFTTEQVADLAKFTCEQSPVNARIILSLCLYTAIPAILLTLRFSPFPFFPVGMVISILLMLLLSIIVSVYISKSRKSCEFLINKKEIVIKDKTYDQEQVSNYFIKPSYHRIEPLADAGYKICMEYGKQNIVLAKGLNRKDADLLLEAILKEIQFDYIAFHNKQALKSYHEY